MTAPVAHQWHGEITASLEHALFEQSRRNELNLAWVRFVTLALVAIGDWLSYAVPPPPILVYPVTTPLITSGWAVFSLGLALVLRKGWYHPRVREVLPAVDGVLTGLALWNLAFQLGPAEFQAVGGLTTSGLACAVLAATGALRLTEQAASITAGMALGIYAGVALTSGGWTSVTFVHLSLIFGIGMLGVRMTGEVRRATQSELGRATLERFLPSHVVQGAYGSTDGLLTLLTEPRNVRASILVTDLRGFTALAETMTPVEALAFLNTVQGRLANVVQAHGGTVDKFLGDGMLAVFGAPEPLPDHAARALAAALAMLDSTRDLPRVRLGVGLHSGPVVTGCLGSGTRLEFTVIGDTVNTAARLEGLTKEKGYDMVVSADAIGDIPADLLAGVLGGWQLVALGDAAIRGRRDTLGLFGVAAQATRTTPTAILSGLP